MAINPTDLGRPDSPHVGSYWAATAGAEVERTDPIAGDIEVEVAIIGGGYTGLSTAYHLSRDFGIAAHVLEANRIAWGCSGRNGGFCSIGIGKEDYGAWVERWGADGARALIGQGVEGVRTVRGLLAAEAIEADEIAAELTDEAVAAEAVAVELAEEAVVADAVAEELLEEAVIEEAVAEELAEEAVAAASDEEPKT